MPIYPAGRTEAGADRGYPAHRRPAVQCQPCRSVYRRAGPPMWCGRARSRCIWPRSSRCVRYPKSAAASAGAITPRFFMRSVNSRIWPQRQRLCGGDRGAQAPVAGLSAAAAVKSPGKAKKHRKWPIDWDFGLAESVPPRHFCRPPRGLHVLNRQRMRDEGHVKRFQC